VSHLAPQQVREGYKQTEVGVVPNEWGIVSIDRAITERIILDQMDGNHGELYPKSHEFSDFGVPYVGATDFDCGIIDFKHCKYIPEKRAALFKKGIAKNGDVLFAHNATVGPVAMVEIEVDYIILSTTATYYRCDNKVLLNSYLKAYFESGYFVGQYKAVMSQSTRNQVPILAQRKFSLVLPPFEEQTAIANALSDVDALITSLEKLIAKKRAIKTAAMQQLLTGKKRLPPFDQVHTGYKQTELGEIPEDWEVVELGAIGQNLIGLTYSPNDVVEHGTLVLRSSNVQKNKLAFQNNVFVDMELPNRVIVKEGDILICVRNGSKQLIGKCALIDKTTEGVAFGAFMSIYRTEFSSFIFYQFQSNIIQRQIDEIMGATINQITNKDMAVFKVPLPNDTNEQLAISNVLSDMDTEIDALEQRLKKIQQLKQGMMQELLTGRTRLL
jgi:type I restriction enzyme S subunit